MKPPGNRHVSNCLSIYQLNQETDNDTFNITQYQKVLSWLLHLWDWCLGLELQLLGLGIETGADDGDGEFRGTICPGRANVLHSARLQQLAMRSAVGHASRRHAVNIAITRKNQ